MFGSAYGDVVVEVSMSPPAPPLAGDTDVDGGVVGDVVVVDNPRLLLLNGEGVHVVGRVVGGFGVTVGVVHATVVLDAGRLDESALPFQDQLLPWQPYEGVRFGSWADKHTHK